MFSETMEIYIMYAVFRVKELAPPNRMVLAYGKNDPDTHVGYFKSGCSARIIEHCASIRVASASLALRNEVSRELGHMISAAARKGASADTISLLAELRDADPADAQDLIAVRETARGFLKSVGVDVDRTWSDDARATARLTKKLEKYQAQRAKFQK